MLINTNLTMKSPFLYLLGIMLSIIAGTFFYCHFCCNVLPENKEIIGTENETIDKINFNKNSDSLPKFESEINTTKNKCDAVLGKSFTVNFTSGQTVINLSVDQHNELERIAECISELNISLSITGHTDNTGSDETNLKIGLLRANAIKTILIDKGAPKSNIITLTKGESEPVADNNTEKGKAKNRRIEFRIN